MIEHFAAVERSVTEMLIGLKLPACGRMPHLAGQRRAALRLGLDSSKALAKAQRALDAIAQFERLAPRRTFLCHGVGCILMDARGVWHLHLRVLAPEDDATAEIEWTVSKTESETLLASTKPAARRVIDRLAQVRAG